MHFCHTFLIKSPQPEVLEFHRHPSALAAITPPPIIMQLHEVPDPLSEGSTMRFTTWFGPIPLHWHSRIEDVDDTGFTDQQICGPFQSWIHRHDFIFQGESRTEVQDQIDYAIRPHLFWGPIGLAMRLGLPFLFAFRAWKTRRLLERS